MAGDTANTGSVDEIGFPTPDGIALDGRLHRVDAPRAVAVVTHPHPQMGGDMHNPVPVGVCTGLAGQGVAALRFDFRGAGRSGGEHGGGEAERGDVVGAISLLAERWPVVPVLGVGYSFGADVLLATDDDRLGAVVAVAAPLRILPLDVLRAPRGGAPTLLLAPAHDQFCPPERATAVTGDWPSTVVEAVPGADHFLSGAVQRVVDRVLRVADDVSR